MNQAGTLCGGSFGPADSKSWTVYSTQRQGLADQLAARWHGADARPLAAAP